MEAKLEGVTLYYELTGAGSPLTLVHGLGGSTEGWAAVVPAFAEHYRVLTFDVRGFGRSEKPPGDFSPSLFARDLRHLLDHLGVERTHLVGVSMGGVIAQRFALDYPGSVSALVLISTSSQVGPAATAAWEDLVSAVEREGMGVLERRPLRAFSRRFLAEHDDEVREYIQASIRRNQPSAYARAARAISAYDYTPELSGLRCPALVLQGADDELTPPGGSVIMSRAIPGARLVIIEDCGHAVTIEKPERLVSEVLGFLQAVESRSATA